MSYLIISLKKINKKEDDRVMRVTKHFNQGMKQVDITADPSALDKTGLVIMDNFGQEWFPPDDNDHFESPNRECFEPNRSPVLNVGTVTLFI
mmetsp:Transcript_39447/g.63959  ORF Transcript_39447/g.63959 Transcript_39447/m.63959 type:complete len:92 (-) Transcript_39447:262-537(-)